MKVDFTKKLLAQKAAVKSNGLAQSKLPSKYAQVLGITDPQMKSQLKSAAKAVHRANQAHKTQGLLSKAVGQIVNGLYIGNTY